jgi:hypothetical protein
MQSRIIGINLPFSVLNSDSLIQFLKTNGFITLMKYAESIVDAHNTDEFQRLIDKGYIISFLTSNELQESIGVSRKGLLEYHKRFEELRIAKVFSTSRGYIVVLGKEVDGMQKMFIGNDEFYDNEISKIENIVSGEDIPEEIVKVKKVKKLKVEKKEVPNIMNMIDKANSKVRKSKTEYADSIKKRQESIANPSQKVIYQKHKSTKPEDWNMEDFLGLYLNEYKKMMGVEDTDFINLGRSKTRLLLMNMGKCKSFYFAENAGDFASYILWAMKYINDPETWITSPVSIHNIVSGNLSKNLIKEYSISKNVKISGKSRTNVDNDLSEKDYWKEKYINSGK